MRQHIPSRWSRPAFALLATLLCATPAPAADAADEVKARFVFQLLRYVTWPDGQAAAGSPFVVGVVADEGFAATLEQVVSGKQAQGRDVEVRRLADDAASAPGVHLLFARASDSASLRKLARDHHGQPVLTVADAFEFPELGGDVGLELIGDRVSFSISRRKSVRGDFVISSKLLRLASEVK